MDRGGVVRLTLLDGRAFPANEGTGGLSNRQRCGQGAGPALTD
jgi:hypothetical protein